MLVVTLLIQILRVPMLDGNDPGFSSPRPLRGFRRRWTDLGSGAAQSHAGSSEVDSNDNGNVPGPPCNGSGSLHESQLRGLDMFGFPAGSEELHGWEHVHKCLSEGKSDGYEPSSPGEDVSALQVGPNVTDPMRVEPEWQNRALASRSKCQRVDREKLPWEQSPFSFVFGAADKWQGTAVSNLDRHVQTHNIWLFRCFAFPGCLGAFGINANCSGHHTCGLSQPQKGAA